MRNMLRAIGAVTRVTCCHHKWFICRRP